MNIEINILGTEDALNTWTHATATVDGKTYKVQMVRFDEPSMYGIRLGRISKLWVAEAGVGVILGGCLRKKQFLTFFKKHLIFT